ncbi:MAG: carboxypeptidase-like regulatory domain-containing protein [Chitinophagales bacterium]|nr:carboxypeptidase-like regulatory domain-containing protein [Chitinophagales bacterium]
MKNVLLIFCLLSSISTAFAQALIGGTVLNEENKQPVPFASVILNGTFNGTTTDKDGKFLLEIPNYNQDNKFTFKIIGYEEKTISLVELMRSDVIYLKVKEEQLNEVVVTPINAYKLINEAADKIPENHYSVPIGQEVFYRQTLTTNNELSIVEEGHYDILNTFNRKALPRNATIKKARGFIDLTPYRDLGKIVSKNIEDDSLDIEQSSQIVLGFNPDLEDLRSDKNSVLGKNNDKNYVFNYAGMAIKNGVVMHIITFDQAEGIKKTLFKGTVYIDTASLAIVEIDVHLSPEGIDFQKLIPLRFRLLMKLGGYTVSVKALSFSAKYVKYGDFWVINEGGFNGAGNISRRDKVSLNGNLINNFKVLRNYDRAQFYRKNSDYNTIPSKIEDFSNKYFWGGTETLKMDGNIESLLNKKMGVR